jgi:hypothetical protein
MVSSAARLTLRGRVFTHHQGFNTHGRHETEEATDGA